MESTTTQTRSRGTVRGRGSARGPGGATSREAEFDLLTAALIGVAIGVGTTLLLRSGPSGRSPAAMVVRGAGHLGERALGRGGSPMERIQRKVRGEAAEYARAARAAVDEMAESELRALRRAIRRRRKQLGL